MINTQENPQGGEQEIKKLQKQQILTKKLL